jgi:hypothetical protein
MKIFKRALGPTHVTTAACLDHYVQLLRRVLRTPAT